MASQHHLQVCPQRHEPLHSHGQNPATQRHRKMEVKVHLAETFEKTVTALADDEASQDDSAERLVQTGEETAIA